MNESSSVAPAQSESSPSRRILFQIVETDEAGEPQRWAAWPASAPDRRWAGDNLASVVGLTLLDFEEEWGFEITLVDDQGNPVDPPEDGGDKPDGRGRAKGRGGDEPGGHDGPSGS